MDRISTSRSAQGTGAATRGLRSSKRMVSWSRDRTRDPASHRAQGIHAGRADPHLRGLAAEFGANKNTVSKAYRSLAQRGYLLTRAGFGTFISKRPVRVEPRRRARRHHRLAFARGAGSEAQRTAARHSSGSFVDDVVTQAYGHAGPRIGFIECNRHDATMLSRDLQLAVSHPIEPLLIDAVLAEPGRFLGEYDILAVNITHLSAIESALGTRNGLSMDAPRSSACISRSIRTACCGSRACAPERGSASYAT